MEKLSGCEHMALDAYRELVRMARGVMTQDMLDHLEHGSVTLMDIERDLKNFPVPKQKALGIIALAVAEAYAQIELEKDKT